MSQQSFCRWPPRECYWCDEPIVNRVIRIYDKDVYIPTRGDVSVIFEHHYCSKECEEEHKKSELITH